ncbi:hypothetical protein PV350_45375, partial [Streptomyces sp. PA03-6a]|nr:hypothetical protein [Streptomyces sp. PA03-6a]
APPRSPGSAQRRRPGFAVAVIAGLAAACVGALLLYGRTIDGAGEPGGSGSPDRGSVSQTAPSGGDEKAAPAADPPSTSYKGVDLADGYTISLSDLPPKPYHPRVGPYYEGDFGYTWGARGWGFATPEGNTLVLLTSRQTGSLATCRSATRYSQEISRKNAVGGSRICVVTDAGHIALVTVRDYSPEGADNDYATVDLTVWQNAETPGEE